MRGGVYVNMYKSKQCMYILIYIYLSINLSIYRSIYRSIDLSIYLSIDRRESSLQTSRTSPLHLWQVCYYGAVQGLPLQHVFPARAEYTMAEMNQGCGQN